MTAVTSWIVACSAAVAATAVVTVAREVRANLREMTQTIEANRWRSRVVRASLRRRDEIKPTDRAELADPPERVEE